MAVSVPFDFDFRRELHRYSLNLTWLQERKVMTVNIFHLNFQTNQYYLNGDEIICCWPAD